MAMKYLRYAKHFVIIVIYTERIMPFWFEVCYLTFNFKNI
jgi:hypothetical protein